jgi:hypothetical protein
MLRPANARLRMAVIVAHLSVRRKTSDSDNACSPPQFTLFPVAIQDTKSGREGSAQMAPEAAFLVPTQLRTFRSVG